MQIIPKLSASELGTMEKKLNQRFKKVAKTFGKGLGASILGGGLVGAAMGVVDKILNPLQATQEAIDRSLKSADDVVTNARQFGSSPGELARLRAMGQAKGIDPSDLDVMLSKYQGAIADANKDPSKASAVANYRDDKNIVTSFFQFMQNLGRMDDMNARRSAQEEVFGEKQILKMADFLNQSSDEWFALSRDLKNFDTDRLTQSLEKQGNLADYQDLLRAKRGLDDINAKGALISQGMITQQDARERIALGQENRNIGRYGSLNELAMAADRITNMLSTLLTDVAAAGVKLSHINDVMAKMPGTSLWKGILKFVRVE
jgi:hypothetical protein